jgi:3-demethoxyubiquinol 3-hydroxylase
MTSPTVPARTDPFPENRAFGGMDRLLTHLDRALKTVLAPAPSVRPYPADKIAETIDADGTRREVSSLMRINHAGEVAAQALYQGHALTASSTETRDSMEQASRDEADHLAWCRARIEELGGRTSLLTPLWYAGSFAIGAAAGLAGDRYSLGFVAETERQVVDHLESHLRTLPKDDARTHAILRQMTNDEERHGEEAQRAGGAQLPSPIRRLMKFTARIMTRTAYWV